ncbi:hypothetical protein [Hoeflea ulvae]|uniref:Uncharacterized protein n=1 Tax=Hoeflea ulvae TaxID=2983764 RepID=A0ABT3YGZ9_9HYPH|nr:hypothetical protein [Hoeflea ulvae]MCY0095182.1 hypothetical protein [Hoeflea ulvae]
MRSSTDIVSISTGRETILIGPLSAFGAQAASVVLRERFSILQALEVLLSRPNSEQLIRPHLRNWGMDPVSLRVATRHTLIHALARSASSGAIGIAKVPDVTLSFAGASLDEDFKQASVKPIAGGALPPDLSDRMMIVFEMAPQYMEGETRLAFENAVRDLGMGLIVGAVVAWVGAHFIPGVNIAVLAFDLFFLSASVLHALERAHEIVGEVRDAKSRAELKPAAIAMAAVLSVLIVEGVLGRLLKAKSLTKGVGKTGGHSDAKPSVAKQEPKTRQRDRVREKSDPPEEPPNQASPGRNRQPFMKRKTGQREPGAVPMDPALRKEINGAAQARAKGPIEKPGWPTLRGQERGTFKSDPEAVTLKPGTKLYRVVDAESNPDGAFWSLEPPPRSEADWRSGSAVLNDWNGDGAYVEHTVGKEGLNGWMGPARAQRSSDGVSALKGGADQFVIPPGTLKAPLTPKPTPWNNQNGT